MTALQVWSPTLLFTSWAALGHSLNAIPQYPFYLLKLLPTTHEFTRVHTHVRMHTHTHTCQAITWTKVTTRQEWWQLLTLGTKRENVHLFPRPGQEVPRGTCPAGLGSRKRGLTSESESDELELEELEESLELSEAIPVDSCRSTESASTANSGCSCFKILGDKKHRSQCWERRRHRAQ